MRLQRRLATSEQWLHASPTLSMVSSATTTAAGTLTRDDPAAARRVWLTVRAHCDAPDLAFEGSGPGSHPGLAALPATVPTPVDKPPGCCVSCTRPVVAVWTRRSLATSPARGFRSPTQELHSALSGDKGQYLLLIACANTPPLPAVPHGADRALIPPLRQHRCVSCSQHILCVMQEVTLVTMARVRRRRSAVKGRCQVFNAGSCRMLQLELQAMTVVALLLLGTVTAADLQAWAACPSLEAVPDCCALCSGSEPQTTFQGSTSRSRVRSVWRPAARMEQPAHESFRLLKRPLCMHAVSSPSHERTCATAPLCCTRSPSAGPASGGLRCGAAGPGRRPAAQIWRRYAKAAAVRIDSALGTAWPDVGYIDATADSRE